MWNYKAVVLRVIDGDTVDLCVDLGFDIHVNLRVRINGIDTPELHSRDPILRAKAIMAKARVAELLPVNLPVIITTEKDRQEKYGRYLANIELADLRSVSSILIAEGLAVAYDGGTRG